MKGDERVERPKMPRDEDSFSSRTDFLQFFSSPFTMLPKWFTYSKT